MLNKAGLRTKSIRSNYRLLDRAAAINRFYNPDLGVNAFVSLISIALAGLNLYPYCSDGLIL